MKRAGLLVILIRLMILTFFFREFGVDIATFYAVFLISADLLQMRLDIEEIKNNDL